MISQSRKVKVKKYVKVKWNQSDNHVKVKLDD